MSQRESGYECMEQLAELETHVRAAWQKDERQTLHWKVKQQIAELAELTAA